MNITSINARTILDSRGNPTVEVDVHAAGYVGRAAVPSGASTGSHEAHELRDGGTDWHGNGVNQAVHNIHTEIANALIGIDTADQVKIDQTLISLDGTSQKSRLGANAILAVSLAAAHAAAQIKKVALWQHINELAGHPTPTLPLPMCNVLNGGSHASGASDFQEFMVVPSGAATMHDCIKMLSEIFQELKRTLHARGLSTTVGDEGGFAPMVSSNTETLDLLMEAVEAAGYQPGTDVYFALDVAATEFFTNGQYQLQTEHRTVTAEELVTYLAQISQQYPIISIEDALAEDSWIDWHSMTKQLGHLQLVGDDLLVTNQTRLERAISEQAGNAILIKPNQIGTLSESIASIKTAQTAGWRTIVSHRSGETEDITIAHLAVGTGAGQIKTGSVSRGERTAKYNELLRIAEEYSQLQLAKPFADQR